MKMTVNPALMVSALLLFATCGIAQEATVSQPNPKPSKEAGGEGSSDDDAEPKDAVVVEEESAPTRNDILQLIRSRKLMQATKALEQAITATPEDSSLQETRYPLALGFLSGRKYPQAFEHAEKLVEFKLEAIDDAKQVKSMANTMGLLRMLGSRTGKQERVDELLTKTFESLDEVTKDNLQLRASGYTSYVSLMSQHLSSAGLHEDARDILDKFKKELSSVDLEEQSDSVRELVSAAKAQVLYTAAMLRDSGAAERKELEDYIATALEALPDSSKLMLQYARTQMLLVSQTYRDDPDAAQARIDAAIERLESEKFSSDRSLANYVKNLRGFERRIESTLKLKKMVGQPAPKFDIAHWVNQGETTVESLQGKVVLVDFWSVWCGPCIATFPRLKQWREDYADQGFEIVGVTRHYNYSWNESSGRPQRSKIEVSPEDENEMLTKFLESHELSHPTIVTPKGSSMQKEFGVTSIPHVALLDRKGNVQLVKIGAQRSAADEIEAKIEELLAE